MILRLVHLQVVKYRDDVAWSDVCRTQSVASTNDEWFVFYIIECTLYIQVQWFTFCTRLFCAVKHSNSLYCLRNSSQQVLYREWTIQVYRNHSHFLAFFHLVVNHLASSFASRSHQNDDVLCILCTIIREDMIFTSCQIRDLFQVAFNYIWNIVIMLVTCFTMCKEGLWVFSGTTCYRAFGCQCTITETLNVVVVNHVFDSLFINHFNFMIFMRGTETIKEIDEWNACFQGCQVWYG